MIQSVEEKTLETLVGPLAKTFPQFDRATIRHSDELTTERRTNPKLRNQWFYTADFPLYTVEKEGKQKEAYLSLARGENNLTFDNIGEATNQLIRTGNYRVTNRADVERVTKAESTLRVKLSDLRLQGDDNVFRYFEIDIANYNKLNPEQRRVAERVYGQGDNFKENMRMFNWNGIKKTRVYVLNPDYVKQNTPQDGGFAWASRLVRFDFDSRFFALDWGVDYHLGLRGVRNIVAEGYTPKVEANPVADAYKTILGANPEQALRAMTPETATGLSRLLQMYNSQKQ